MQGRMIVRKILNRFFEGLFLTIVGFTLFDLFWYGYDSAKGFINDSNVSIAVFRSSLNLSRLLVLPTIYSFALVIFDSLGVKTTGPLFDWIQERLFGIKRDKSGKHL